MLGCEYLIAENIVIPNKAIRQHIYSGLHVKIVLKKDQKTARFSCLNFHERSPEDYFVNRIPMVVYTQIKGNNLIKKILQKQ